MNKINDIILPNGVVLKEIPISPNDDYMAGDDGFIYSRTKYKGFGKKVYVDWYPLVGCSNGNGYPSVSLCHENKKVTSTVHRLICMAFHGMPPLKSSQVRHLDGSKDNNCPYNLRWGTQYENWEDRKAHGNGMEGEKHPMSKVSDFERECIIWAVEKGIASTYQIGRVLGLSQSTISKIVKNSK